MKYIRLFQSEADASVLTYTVLCMRQREMGGIRMRSLDLISVVSNKLMLCVALDTV